MTLDTAAYRRARAAGIGAVNAAAIARYQPEEPPATADGFAIAVQDEPDPLWTLSDGGYGEWLRGAGDDWRTGRPRRPHPDAIRNPHGSYRDGNAWYLPSEPIRTVARYLNRGGMAKGPAWDRAREQAEEELSRLADGWGPDIRCVTVTASRAGVTLGEASCGGVEIAWDPITRRSGEEYVWEVARDLIADAVDQARETLAALIAAA